jgi:hypothetical protein
MIIVQCLLINSSVYAHDSSHTSYKWMRIAILTKYKSLHYSFPFITNMDQYAHILPVYKIVEYSI